jgi:DNA-binding SARP family transcriptional activator/predicted ATPase
LAAHDADAGVLGQRVVFPVQLIAAIEFRVVSVNGETATSKSVLVRVCGSLEVEIGAQRIEDDALPRWHVRALLALIAGSAGMSMDREAASEALWPDSDPSTSRNRLYHTVMMLRRALSEWAGPEDWIFVSGGRVRLHEAVASDAFLIRQLAAADDPQRVSQWLMQQAGPLPPFAPWLPDTPQVNAVRSEIQAAWLGIIRQVVGRTASNDDTPARRRLIEHLLVLAPTNEAVHCALMLLDLRAGRAHRVLRQYDACARILAEQLGLKPSSQAVDLARRASRLLSEDSASGHHVLPGRVRDLSIIGRIELLAEVAAALREPSARVVTLVGIGGVGKSRIAREVGGMLAGELEDGVLWVDLRLDAGMPPTADGVLRRLRERTRPAVTDAEPGGASTADFCGLIVLDNAEMCSDPSSLLAALGTAVPSARWLVTGIKPTGVGSERSFRIGTLPVPRVGATSAELRANPAVQLLLRRAFPVERLDHDRLTEVGHLARKLDGLPLALELAATRLSLRTAAEISAELDHDLRPLDNGPIDFEGHQQSITSTFDQTINGLSSGALALYRVAAVPAGEFDLDLLVTLDPGLALAPDMAARLGELEQLGLIAAVSPTTTPGRWRMSHLARLHAAELARRGGLDLALKDRHLTWVAQVLADLTGDHDRPSHGVIDAIDRLHADIGAALRHADRTQSPLLPLVASRVGAYWNLRGCFAIAQRWLEAACNSLRAVPSAPRHRLMARLLIHLASMHLLQLRVVTAAPLALEALDEAQVAGDAPLLADAADLRVRVLMQGGRLSEAIACAEEWCGRLGDDLGRPLQHSLRLARVMSGSAGSASFAAEDGAGTGAGAGDSTLAMTATEWAGFDDWLMHYRHGDWPASLQQARRWFDAPLVGQVAHFRAGAGIRCAWSEVAVDDLSSALLSANTAAEDARQAGLPVIAAQAALVSADILIRTGDLDAADRILADTVDIVMDPSCGVPLQADWHVKAGLLAIARGRLSSASEQLLALTSDPCAFEDIRTLATIAELGVVVCSLGGHVEPVARINGLLAALDRPGLALRVPLEQRWLRQQLRGIELASVPSSVLPAELVAELSVQLSSLALVLTAFRGSREAVSPAR